MQLFVFNYPVGANFCNLCEALATPTPAADEEAATWGTPPLLGRWVRWALGALPPTNGQQ